MLAAFDVEGGFRRRAWDFATAEFICGVLKFEDGRTVVACPRLGLPISNLLPYFNDPDLLIAMHHSDAERRFMKAVGVDITTANYLDTELIERVIGIALHGGIAFDRPVDGQGPYTLQACRARRGLRNRPSAQKKAMQEKCGTLKFADSDLPLIVKYCTEDVDETLELARHQLTDYEKFTDRMKSLYWGLIQPHHLRVSEASERGFCFDYESYAHIIHNREAMLDKLQREIRQLGFVGKFFHCFEKLTTPRLNIPTIHTFETLGLHELIQSLEVFKQDVNKDYIQQRRSLKNIFRKPQDNDHEFIKCVHDYHAMINLSTKSWMEFLQSDRRIRPGCVFPGASSYRAQQFKPHPLQLPMFARPLVTAKPGYLLLQIDFKAQEIGLASSFFNDPDLLDIFNNFQMDLYAEIGARMGEYPIIDGHPACMKIKANKDLRNAIKTAVLAISYGGSIPALMENLRCSRSRAQQFLRRFWAAFPWLHEHRNHYLKQIQTEGVAFNLIGLERKFVPDVVTQDGLKDLSLSFLNFPIQSAGSVVLMQAMADLPSHLQPNLLMHDALMFEVEERFVFEAEREARRVMENASKKLFPELACRCESQAAFRFYKDDAESLHSFCKKYGPALRREVGTVIDFERSPILFGALGMRALDF